jgi:hypothetical protein
MKKLIVLLILLMLCGVCEASDIPLRWDVATGVTGYKVYMSIDGGVTWANPIDVGNVTTYTYLSVIDTALVMFKISSYNANGEAVINWAGAWYDGRKKPPNYASYLGVQK